MILGMFVVDRDEELLQRLLGHYVYYDKSWSWVRDLLLLLEN